MQIQTCRLHPCFKHVVTLWWLLTLATQAVAQRGVIVIQGEITAPTCVVNHMVIAATGIEQSVRWKDCVENTSNISRNTLSEMAQIREDALAADSKKRIRTLTYR